MTQSQELCYASFYDRCSISICAIGINPVVFGPMPKLMFWGDGSIRGQWEPEPEPAVCHSYSWGRLKAARNQERQWASVQEAREQEAQEEQAWRGRAQLAEGQQLAQQG